MKPHLTDEQAQSLVDGLLAERLRDAYEAHAGACAECRVLVESYRALGDALAGLDAPLPPPDFTDAVMARIDVREAARAWERRLALGILGAAACAAVVIFALLGANAWAPVFSRLSGGIRDAATAFSVGADVCAPLLRALRVQIALGSAALALPLFYALSRLAPRGAHATA
jgi:anti-sigma factor RsiW